MNNRQDLLTEHIEPSPAYAANHSRQTFLMSIIIPSYNREDSLPLVLSKMEELAEPLKNVEIIIVDDGSTDGTKDLIAKFSACENLAIRCFYEKNQGAAHARNMGVQKACSPLVLFLDSDIIPTKELIDAHLDFHQQHPEDPFVLRGRVETHKDVPSIRKVEVITHKDQQELDWTEVRSNNISMKKDFLLKAGGFDGDLSAHQDTELGHRLGKQGMRLFHSNKALGFHYHPVGLKEYFRYAEKYGISRAIWLFKSPDLIEDAVRVGKEDRYGFIAWESPWQKKIKYLLKVLTVNRFTVDAWVAMGNMLAARNRRNFFFFYRQAYQYYSRLTFQECWKEIQAGRLAIKRPPRVCMLAGPLFPEFSGAAVQSMRVSEYIKRRGYDVFYISPTFQEKSTRQGYLNGIKYYRVYTGHSFLAKILFSLKVFRLLLKYRDRYDVVHLHGGGFLASGATLIGKILNKRSIYKMTSFGQDDPRMIKQSRFSWMKFPLVAMADKVIAMSSVLEESYLEAGLEEDRLSRIPNCVDLERFSPVSSQQKKELRKKLNLPEDAFIGLSVSTITPRKRVDVLAKAWETVLRRNKNAVLLMVGAFYEAEKDFCAAMRKLAASPPFLNKVFLLGMQNNVEEYMQAADVFLFASSREGFATVQVEAMGCGLPCICAYIKGISEDIFVDGGTGIVLRDTSAESFAENIIMLMDNPHLSKTMGENARGSAKQKFALEQVGEQYVRLYRSLMSDTQLSPSVLLVQT